MLARALTSRIKRAPRPGPAPEPPSPPTPHSKMGNTPSTPNSPRSVRRGSSLSSSVGMPGGEQPGVDGDAQVEGTPGAEGAKSTAAAPEAGAPEAQEQQEPRDDVALLIPPVPAETDAPAQADEPGRASPSTAGGQPRARADSPRHAWVPGSGTHVLLNARSGSALALCGHAPRGPVAGLPVHTGPDQQWEFVPSGQGYAIRSASPAACGLYLTVEELRDHAPVVAASYPVSWDVGLGDGGAEDVIRISWPNTDFVVDLADGNAAPGTQVQLMRAQPGERCQLWRLTRGAAPDEETARAATAPVVSETVLVSEGRDGVTTTRTTTTTTVVTTVVTMVTRTPRAGRDTTAP